MCFKSLLVHISYWVCLFLPNLLIVSALSLLLKYVVGFFVWLLKFVSLMVCVFDVGDKLRRSLRSRWKQLDEYGIRIW